MSNPQYKVSWEFKPKKHADLIAILKIDDTVIRATMEERRPDVWWVHILVLERGSVPTPDVFVGIADFLEQFVIDRKPMRLTIHANKHIKAETYKKTLLERAPKYGYEIEERITPQAEEDFVYTIIKTKESN